MRQPDSPTAATQPVTMPEQAELAPVYAEFGAAVHDTQVLEFGLMLLMQLGGDGSAGGDRSTLLLGVSGLAGASAMILPGVSGGYLLLLLGLASLRRTGRGWVHEACLYGFAALLFSMEPVFAALFAYLLLEETLAGIAAATCCWTTRCDRSSPDSTRAEVRWTPW